MQQVLISEATLSRNDEGTLSRNDEGRREEEGRIPLVSKKMPKRKQENTGGVASPSDP